MDRKQFDCIVKQCTESDTGFNLLVTTRSGATFRGDIWGGGDEEDLDLIRLCLTNTSNNRSAFILLSEIEAITCDVEEQS